MRAPLDRGSSGHEHGGEGREEDQLQEEAGHDGKDRPLLDGQMFAGGPDVCWEEAAEHEDCCSGCPASKMRDLQSDGDREFGDSGHAHPEPRIAASLRNHADQVRAPLSPVGRGGQQKHDPQCGAERGVPVGEVRHEEAYCAEDEKGDDQADQRGHT